MRRQVRRWTALVLLFSLTCSLRRCVRGLFVGIEVRRIASSVVVFNCARVLLYRTTLACAHPAALVCPLTPCLAQAGYHVVYLAPATAQSTLHGGAGVPRKRAFYGSAPGGYVSADDMDRLRVEQRELRLARGRAEASSRSGTASVHTIPSAGADSGSISDSGVPSVAPSSLAPVAGLLPPLSEPTPPTVANPTSGPVGASVFV